MADLPSELLSDILSYLPLKDILRFRSVSRLWKSIIRESSFSSLHFRRCRNNIKKPYLIFQEGHWISRENRASNRWVLRCSETYVKDTEIELLGGENKNWLICSALDGLFVLLVNQYRLNLKDNIILWNPSIRKSIYLQTPPPPAASPWMQLCYEARDLHVCLALLFESSSDDYKVLIIRYLGYYKSFSTSSFDLFSLKSGSWKRVVDNHSVTDGMMFYNNNVSIGGSAYWIRSNEKRSLILFNLRSNMFLSTPLPMEAKNISREKLIVLPDSTLGLLLVKHPSDHIDIAIWAMERSISASAFDRHCWTERYEIQLDIPMFSMYMPEPFFVPIQKRNILLWGYKSLISYDLDIDELEHVIKNYLYTPKYIAPYVESLLLLEHVAKSDSAVPSTCT